MITAQTAVSAWWFLPFAAPIAIWVAWSDMATMKIPNKAVYALVLVYLVVGLLALPFADYAWRLLHLAVVLVIGFAMNVVRFVGAGDAKFAAAMAPFVVLADVVMFLYLFAAVIMAGYLTHRAARRLPAVRARTETWESWQRQDFPMGLCLGGALLFYLLIGAVAGQ